MAKYEFSDNQIRNLLTFLNRAEIKGFHEIQAINDIVSILNNPLLPEENETKGTS
ncbi:hypothetical protein [Paenibacillus oleatilyticus]|uniref:hypothetical protein n=1 Tax=Paenibacillus oleatilyticus TaxID=2594886 RepID=UPI001C1F5E6D|nr:hypothetical protein [Paenibacillus oleatilyticus]MBU7316150.1 hypothetical protein [Paenibacillus oleatilyticus]